MSFLKQKNAANHKWQNMSVSRLLIKLFAVDCLLFGITGIVFSFKGELEYIAVYTVLFLSFLTVLLARKNSLVFIMAVFMAYANYSALASNYFADYYEFYIYYAGTEIAALGTFILLIFMSVLVFFFPQKIKPFKGFNFFLRCTQSNYSTPVSLFIAVVLVVISFTQSSGFSDTGGRGEANALYEYSYVFFIIGYFYAGKNKACRRALDCVALLYFLQAILGGNRASVLAIVLLLYILYIAPRFSTTQQTPFIVIGFLLFQVVGYVREDIDLITVEELNRILSDILSRGLIWDTAGAAYHQSLAFLYFLQTISPNEVLYYIEQWFIGIFLGTSAVPDASLPHVVQNALGQFERGGFGGGFFPLYCFFYFGLIGVAVGGYCISLAYRAVATLSIDSNNLICILTVAVFITIPRWWLYYPTPLTRGLLLMLLIGGAVCLLNGRIKIKSEKNKHESSFVS